MKNDEKEAAVMERKADLSILKRPAMKQVPTLAQRNAAAERKTLEKNKTNQRIAKIAGKAAIKQVKQDMKAMKRLEARQKKQNEGKPGRKAKSLMRKYKAASDAVVANQK